MRHVYRVIKNETCTGLSEMWHQTYAQGYQKWDMCTGLTNVTWDMCTGLSEMWHETCVQGYQKWDMCTGLSEWDICTGLSEMWLEPCVQGYQKCYMRHVYRVIRNVTWDMCIGLSEMKHVHRVIRNVTSDMSTGLSEMWHETCAQGYQKSLIIMNNQLCCQWPLCICIPRYRHNNISIAVTDN